MQILEATFKCCYCSSEYPLNKSSFICSDCQRVWCYSCVTHNIFNPAFEFCAKCASEKGIDYYYDYEV